MLQSREGKRVPDVSFRMRENNEWKSVTSAELFGGKTVVVFSLPGAFTPTCSSTHLLRYNELASAFRANGVDAILCVSVNDAFVMNEWARDQEAGNIVLVPDGNGDFTAGMAATTVPQVFINGTRIGGLEALEDWARKAA